MKILVTGGAGFIGSHIVETYLAAGHQVIIVDNLSSGKREVIPAAATFYPMDIRSSSLAHVFAIEQPEVVNHQAAQPSVPQSLANPTFDADVNIVGLINVLEQSRRHGVQKVIFASSSAVYGTPVHLPIDETHPLTPLSPYGQSKCTGEQYLQLFRRLYGLHFTILRYANVYGPRQDPFGEAGVITIFVEHMLAGQPITIYDDGEQTRDFVYVGDVARANLHALDQGEDMMYNIGTGRATTINELFARLKQWTQYPYDPIYSAPRPGDIRHSVLATEQARKTLDWQPATSLDAGLAQTVAYFREKGAQPVAPPS